MTAVVNETLRVRPVVPIVARMLKRELELDGLAAAGGHARDAVDLPDQPQPARCTTSPSAFLPERFLDERAGDVRLDPVRRRHPPLHRRVVRAAGDEADAAHDARASCSRACPPRAPRATDAASGTAAARSRWSRHVARAWSGAARAGADDQGPPLAAAALDVRAARGARGAARARVVAETMGERARGCDRRALSSRAAHDARAAARALRPGRVPAGPARGGAGGARRPRQPRRDADRRRQVALLPAACARRRRPRASSSAR